MAIIAEIGLDMTVFGTDGRLVSWAKLCPQTRQSGKKSTAASPGKGDPWLKGPLGRGRRHRRPLRHLPRRALPPPRQTARQAQGPGGHRRGTLFAQGSKPGRYQCSPADGHQVPSLPHGGPANTYQASRPGTATPEY